jgi:hypothetical protein
MRVSCVTARGNRTETSVAQSQMRSMNFYGRQSDFIVLNGPKSIINVVNVIIKPLLLKGPSEFVVQMAMLIQPFVAETPEHLTVARETID